MALPKASEGEILWNPSKVLVLAQKYKTSSENVLF